MKNKNNKIFDFSDVKPGNMCIGRLADDQQTVYVVDFGLSRPYRDRVRRKLEFWT